ncbi:HNH endonuclease [Rahnella victoriana]|jgi:hypothetical protein|uniref:HNH endonuclease n=1 Tax=Rahnella victoriana TaxID=1510570 RepID=UPI000BB1D348|nr:HNH endonuclease [Rahnella victoriana]PBI78802.1 hypothetical protein A9993_03270 [Rahnella victoriana]PKB89783.1 hypothetical protein A8A01_11710 [Ewingella americana]TBX35404.1 HNH endonuclease [Rahnella victoriana]VTQ54681.1 Uncharacterised protein [Campylobacter jejuni]
MSASIHKVIGYNIMQFFNDAFSNSTLVDINDVDRFSSICYQELSLENGCSIRFTRWRADAMPFYIILFNEKGRYIFELDLSMLLFRNDQYTWHLKSPQHKTTLSALIEHLGETGRFPVEYIESIRQQKERLQSGINTPKNGFTFLDEVSWNILTPRLLHLVSSVFTHHGINNISYNAPVLPEARDDEEEYEEYRRRVRRGQNALKLKLFELYDSQCAITGCPAVEVLEAAHIVGHAESGINHSANGLLLRADIHILFDKRLLKIDPTTFKVVLNESLKGTGYWTLNGKKLRKRNDGSHPSAEYLAQHFSFGTSVE